MTIPSSFNVPWLETQEIHLWWINLAEVNINRFPWDILDSVEREKASRFRRSCDRDRFAFIRSRLRQLLGAYLAIDPQAVCLDYGGKGKPQLRDGSLEFNVSHSQDLAVWAISREDMVGVDVESIKPDLAVQRLAQRFFTPSEWMALQARPMDQQQSFFFQLWTRKEACIKARGDSLFEQIGHLEIPCQVCCADRWQSLPATSLYVRDLMVLPGYKGAIATPSPNRKLVICPDLLG